MTAGSAEVTTDLPEYTPPPSTLPPTLGERVRTFWDAIRVTPGRAALATLAAGLLIIAAFALQPVEIHARDAAGPLTMRCGLDYFAFGHESEVVQRVCRDEYAGRALVLGVATAGLIASLISLAALLRRPDLPTATDAPFLGTPGRAALTTAAALLLIVAVGSLFPVRVHGIDREGAFSAQCGVTYYVSGHPRAAVERACHHAYAGHAVTLFVTTIGFAIAVSVLATRLRSLGPGQLATDDRGG